MLLIGMAAWTARDLLFAAGDSGQLMWMLYLGILLHGFCYDFFFVSGQIYVDREAPAHLRASAQGFLTLVTWGVGMLIGSWLSGKAVDAYRIAGDASAHDWSRIWLIPNASVLNISTRPSTTAGWTESSEYDSSPREPSMRA